MKGRLQRFQVFDLQQAIAAVGVDAKFASEAVSRPLARQDIYDVLAPSEIGKMNERKKEPRFVRWNKTIIHLRRIPAFRSAPIPHNEIQLCN